MDKPLTSLDLINIAQALAVAEKSRFMSHEHASNVWKNLLKNTFLDVPKPSQDLSKTATEAVAEKKIVKAK